MKVDKQRRLDILAWQTLDAKRVDCEVRICFAISWFDNEELANQAGEASAKVNTYNGGWFHGMACGRDHGFDKVVDGKKLFAVTH